MFKLTDEWLKKYYGSAPNQINQAKSWLGQHSINFKGDPDVWKFYKHLTEYQPNTPDMVDQALAALGTEFESELKCHRWINTMRFPSHAKAYLGACEIVKPRTMLELGVGGDSAISTAIFLSYLEDVEIIKDQIGPYLLSIDRNPLDMTWKRYKDYSFWEFRQSDSVQLLNELCDANARFDMIFIDTIHTYAHTIREMELSSLITDNMLLDDAMFESDDGGVKKAKEEWLEKFSDTWELKGWPGFLVRQGITVENVVLLQRKQIQPKSKIIRRRNV